MIARRALVLAAVLVTAAAFAATANGALFFLFRPAAATAGNVVTVRLGGTPAAFTLADRQRPFRKPMRLYVAPSAVAAEVRSRFDRRLHFVGALVPDRDGRGVLTFRVPPLDSGAYVVAAWCPECARTSFGKTFFVQTVPRVSRYRRSLGLRVRLPSATTTCPVTRGTGYGNGFLATTLPADGVVGSLRRPDGTLFAKPIWTPVRGTGGFDLTVRGDRLDGPGELRVLGVNWGGGSWATAMTFSTEGCWRITGRLGDIALSYVIEVVAA